MADTPETLNDTPAAPVQDNQVPADKSKRKLTLLAGAALVVSASALVLSSLPYFGVGVGAQVRSYLLKNPQILDEMLAVRQQAEEESLSKSIDQAASANPQLLAFDARDPAIGPKDAKVTVVQFFDYRCPGCKAVAGPYNELIARHPEVRFVFKEWPILDNGSTITSNYAARAALAANAQGKYRAVHTALMQERALDEEAINDILRENGVDLAAARQFMTSPDAVRHIADIHTAGSALGLRGTPTFLVNGKASASIDPADVEKMIIAAK